MGVLIEPKDDHELLEINFKAHLTISLLGMLNLRWTSVGPVSSTKLVSMETPWAGVWLANRRVDWNIGLV